MSSKKPKATRRRMISCFAQVVQEHLPGWKIDLWDSRTAFCGQMAERIITRD